MYQCVMNGTDSSMSEILNEIKTTDHILAYQLGTPMTVISYLCSFFLYYFIKNHKNITNTKYTKISQRLFLAHTAR